ncbi:MAG: Membrane-bound lytic murein transglycosylase precursor [Pseudomonadota bacterium]
MLNSICSGVARPAGGWLFALLCSTALLSGCATTAPEMASPSVAPPAAAQTAAPTESTKVHPLLAPGLKSEPPESISKIDPAAQAALPVKRPPDVLDRIRKGFAMPDLPPEVIAPHIKRFSAKQDYLDRVFERGGPYLHHIVEEIEARGLPTELALLPIVESAFNPQATSRAKAAGLWQFIPSTGRVFDLSQNWWTDERRDVIESTRAALEYLQRVYSLQGNDWFLALASYNWGEGSVSRAIKRNQAQGLRTDYLSLKMPKETRGYVPQLIALREIVRDPARYGVTLPRIEDRPHFVAIDKTTSIDRDLAARLAGLSVEEFRALNPHLRRPVITVSRTSRIILPVESAHTYQRNLENHTAKGKPLVSWKPYTLQKGDTLAKVAASRGVTPQTLAEANSLKSARAKLMPGSSILVPIKSGEGSSQSAKIESQLAGFSGAKTVEQITIPAKTYRVKKKDTLQKIARRFGLSVATLRRLNRLEGEVRAGMQLVIRPAQRKTITERVKAD